MAYAMDSTWRTIMIMRHRLLVSDVGCHTRRSSVEIYTTHTRVLKGVSHVCCAILGVLVCVKRFLFYYFEMAVEFTDCSFGTYLIEIKWAIIRFAWGQLRFAYKCRCAIKIKVLNINMLCLVFVRMQFQKSNCCETPFFVRRITCIVSSMQSYEHLHVRTLLHASMISLILI